MKVKIVVTGSRNATDVERPFVWRALDAVEKQYGIEVIAHGAASGVDDYAGQWAKKCGLEPLEFPANWEEHGRAAGPVRNQQMLQEVLPDLVIAFPEPKRRDPHSGTWHCIETAVSMGLFVRCYPLPFAK